MKLKSQKRIERALQVAKHYSQIDGAHHKAWCIDQMVRALCGGDFDDESGFEANEAYEQFVADACYGEDGPNTYGWETGIAP